MSCCACCGLEQIPRLTVDEIVFGLREDGVPLNTEEWIGARLIVQSLDGKTRHTALTDYEAEYIAPNPDGATEEERKGVGRVSFQYEEETFGTSYDQGTLIVQEQVQEDPPRWKEWTRRNFVILPTSADPS
ncbi:hypothetical protein [Planctomyces sp. SH-PL14]|uniref:hypothetical protein n=1 Tax=Planctomyces sp. SH-PL14 TaxID=1632864 RepID=UPI00078D239A|nr:hypothetical protein [Planctomyces sp. SH-PL14]AMV20402.1 hypothetical protein VT03_21065 [Planctomyces sp. SH-PL14]